MAAKRTSARRPVRQDSASYTHHATSPKGQRYSTRAKITEVTHAGAASRYDSYPRFDARRALDYAVRCLREVHAYDQVEGDLSNGLRRDNWRRDASLTAAFARSLEYIYREPYKAIYPQFRARDLIPVITEVPPEFQTHTYRMVDRTGNAKIVNESADDWPAVDVEGEEFQAPIVTIAASYSYGILEAMRAARQGIALDAWKADAARFAIEYLMENIAAVGDPNSGIVGLTNAPGVNATAQTSLGGNWIQQCNAIGAATVMQQTVPALVATQGITADIAAMRSKVSIATKGEVDIDTVAIGYQAMAAIKSAQQSPAYSTKTLKQYIEENQDVDLEMWPQLDTAGAVVTTYNGTQYTGRAMGYRKDKRYVAQVIPQLFTQLPPQPVNMKWKVGCWARHGGVIVPMSLAVTYMDGVS